jgi:hypothetical protein
MQGRAGGICIREDIMTGSSTLDPDNMPNSKDRTLHKGHGTRALGPSDSSDSGSDITGGPGLAQQVDIGLDSGAYDDIERSTAGGTAGPDVGDANLDSGRDTVGPDGADINVDHVETVSLPEQKGHDDVERGP